MRFITIFIALISVSSGFSQLLVGAGVQLHNDNFLWNSGKSPYNQFLQPAVLVDYWWKQVALNGELSLIQSSEELKANYSSFTYGSFGGPGYTYGDYRTAHAEFSYLGMRLGANFRMLARKRFNLVIGISQHWDFLTKEHYSNTYRTTYIYYQGDPPSVPPQFYTPPHYVQEPETVEGGFEVLTLEKMYAYTNFEIKPSFVFGRINVEFQLALSFFKAPRVRNEMAGPENSGVEKYYASPGWFGSNYVANELGICVKYRLSK